VNEKRPECWEPADHWARVCEIIDGLGPSPEQRAWCLRVLSSQEVKAWHARIDELTTSKKYEELARLRVALEGIGPGALLEMRNQAHKHGPRLPPGQSSDLVRWLVPESTAPAKKRGRPYGRLARDLARAVARVWQELTGEYPPISDARTGHEENLYQQLMKHTFGAAGLPHWEIHALEGAKEIRREKEIELRRGNPDFIRWRDDVLRALGELREWRLPKKGRKTRPKPP
jgi:hypothetical protein